MRIILKTKVQGNYKQVFQAFDIKLFKKLKPPFLGLNIIRFDGCKKFDEVHLVTNFFSFKQKWISVITDNGTGKNKMFFTDEGKLLPVPLTYWKHKHIIENSIDSSIIIDDISYNTVSKITDILIYPFLFLLFLLRKPVYKSYFKNSDQ